MIFYENEKPVYNWTELLKHKEKLARTLNYDWYIHVDADEIRCSPWSELTLLDAIKRVDAAGFNVINFKLFNFRMTTIDKKNNTIEENMEYYSKAEYFNGKQLKAWKRDDGVDLASEAGHHVKIKNPKVFPIRFILKHYPARTEAQSVKKILIERKDRFTTEEKNKGWHIHYNSYTDENKVLDSIYYDLTNLKRFEYLNICNALQTEAFNVLCEFISNDYTCLLYGNEFNFRIYWIEYLKIQGFNKETSETIIKYIFEIALNVVNGVIPEVKIDGISIETMERILKSLGVMHYSNGNPTLFDFISENKVFIC